VAAAAWHSSGIGALGTDEPSHPGRPPVPVVHTPQASALTANPPVAAALAGEQLQGWLRIAPAGLRVAVVLRGSTRPRRQVQLLRSAVPGA
jgi:hypothetical protein